MILLDSDVVIAHLRAAPNARAWLREVAGTGTDLGVSVITIAEVAGGMRSEERWATWRLLDSLRTLDVTSPIARRAGEFQRAFRRSNAGISLGDYLIAATADVHGIELATLNVKHFPMLGKLSPPFVLS